MYPFKVLTNKIDSFLDHFFCSNPVSNIIYYLEKKSETLETCQGSFLQLVKYLKNVIGFYFHKEGCFPRNSKKVETFPPPNFSINRIKSSVLDILKLLIL